MSKSKIAEKDLKPCPFCGAEAMCQRAGRGWTVFCSNADCDVGPETAVNGFEMGARCSWNNRAPALTATPPEEAA